MPKLNSRTFASVERNVMMTKEATYFNRWWFTKIELRSVWLIYYRNVQNVAAMWRIQ